MTEDDRRQLEQIHYEYIRAIDEGEPDSLASLFTPDGTFVLGSRMLEGHEKIRAFLEESTSSRPPVYQHLVTNPIISIDGDKATARWSYVVLMADSPKGGSGDWAIGSHNVSYTKNENEWKISRLSAERTYTGHL